ncbi:hypothetical protein CCACVL1_11595 [Corchorus capsularis]|uniref:Uncharacterized protein n=1 Tax=Corchorus capsularis TaxID=210143 RepID=A0A1R3IKB0_COCAP|nr:hypothetical protein CCACVL1_11595 [Corchorus capsularis]
MASLKVEKPITEKEKAVGSAKTKPSSSAPKAPASKPAPKKTEQKPRDPKRRHRELPSHQQLSPSSRIGN